MDPSTPSKSQSVIFSTKTQYVLPSQKFMIPATWRRYQLSQLVNKALDLPKHVPFDFIVQGEVLRSTVDDWCQSNSVGEEETLEIEYIQSVMPPEKVSSIPHEDWVSAVTCAVQGHFFTGSYDGQIRAYSHSKQLVSTSTAHRSPTTSICAVPTTSPLYSEFASQNADQTILASSSLDLTARLTLLQHQQGGDVDMDEQPTTSSSRSTPLASLILHTGPLSSIAVNFAGTHLLTSSWDGLIGFWDTLIPGSDQVEEEQPTGTERKKRRKVDQHAHERPKTKAPISVLKSHTARVSHVLFGGDGGGQVDTAISCAFDSTIRVWDLEAGICAHTVTASEKPFLALSLPPSSFLAPSGPTSTGMPSTILANSTDRTMTLYDLRTSSTASTSGSSLTFIHPSTPSCISTNPNAAYQVVTGAYDGIVRVWDVRSNKGAMAIMRAFSEDGSSDVKKVLSIDWKRGIVAVGGEGGLEVWKLDEGKD